MNTLNQRNTEAYWRIVIGDMTCNLTKDQIAQAAQHAAEISRDGGITCAWHEASWVVGKLESCQCTPCVKARAVAT